MKQQFLKLSILSVVDKLSVKVSPILVVLKVVIIEEIPPEALEDTELNQKQACHVLSTGQV